MDSACSAYPESTPNFFHMETISIHYTIQLIDLHPLYPLSLLLLLLLRRFIFTDIIILREEHRYLQNDDAIRRENFLD
jgi:hypothetical protein